MTTAIGTTPASRGAGAYSTAIGEYIAGALDDELPTDLVEWMKLLVLDSLGCALLAAKLPWVQRVLDTVAAVESPGPASVWGHSWQVSAANAAMVNGTAVHGFELDDVGARGHWGSVTLPAALALAEARGGLSGIELVKAIVTGVEIGSRIAESVGNVPHVDVGFHGPGVYGTFAAAATSSYVLGLNAEQSVNAIATAAQFAGGLMAVHHGGMGKRLLLGKAAHSGVFAAQLAEHGFTNVDNVFECGYGSFPEAFCGGRDTYDLTRLTDGLGRDYRAYGVNYKMWACRVPIHPALEAVRSLRLERQLAADAIGRVEVGLVEGAYKAVGMDYHPSTVTAAQLSLQYCLAVMLLDNDVSVRQFDEQRIADPKVLDLISRINVRLLDSDGEQAYLKQTTLDFTLKDGERVSSTGFQRAPGSDPITAEDVVAKFRRTTANALESAAQDEVISLCAQLETLADVRALLEPIGPRSMTRPEFRARTALIADNSNPQIREGAGHGPDDG
jgi:aconitate decarboxylase